MTAAATWEIFPLELGRRTAHAAWFFYLSEDNGPLEIAYRAWLLSRGPQRVLVDTGPPLDESARRGLRQVVAVDAALAAIGVDAAAIETVVLTHLHWDHAAGSPSLPNARFFVQRAEADYFGGPAHAHPATGRFFSHRHKLQALLDSGRCTFFDGDAPLAPGLDLLHVGGHTPGSQMVRVDTTEGTALITGDVVPLARNYETGTPNGILVNLLDSIAALKRVRELQPVLLYPGHDPVACVRVGAAAAEARR